MHITRLKDGGSLEDFYGADGYLVSVQGYGAEGPAAMQQLLRALCDDQTRLTAYAQIHMHELALLASDKPGSSELVRISASHEYAYNIQYRMSSDAAPWMDAWVTGLATSVDEARQMVLTAMAESGGWNLSAYGT